MYSWQKTKKTKNKLKKFKLAPDDILFKYMQQSIVNRLSSEKQVFQLTNVGLLWTTFKTYFNP